MTSFGEGTHCKQKRAFVALLRMSEAFAFFPWLILFLSGHCDPRSRQIHQHQKVLPGTSLITPLPHAILPADVILLAGLLQIQAVWFLPVLIGAHRNNGLAPPLSTGYVSTGAEEHPVAVLGGDLVKEQPQGLVALALVTDLIGRAAGAGGYVGRSEPLAGII